MAEGTGVCVDITGWYLTVQRSVNNNTNISLSDLSAGLRGAALGCNVLTDTHKNALGWVKYATDSYLQFVTEDGTKNFLNKLKEETQTLMDCIDNFNGINFLAGYLPIYINDIKNFDEQGNSRIIETTSPLKIEVEFPEGCTYEEKFLDTEELYFVLKSDALGVNLPSYLDQDGIHPLTDITSIRPLLQFPDGIQGRVTLGEGLQVPAGGYTFAFAGDFDSNGRLDSNFIFGITGFKINEDTKSERFTDNGDGTITDNQTGLMWLKDAGCFPYKNWADAFALISTFNSNPSSFHCDEYSNSYSDWMLPTKEQFLEIFDASQKNPALPSGHPFMNVRHGLSNGYYWTSTEIDSGGAWVIGLYNGEALYGHKTNVAYIWPMRDPGSPGNGGDGGGGSDNNNNYIMLTDGKKSGCVSFPGIGSGQIPKVQLVGTMSWPGSNSRVSIIDPCGNHNTLTQQFTCKGATPVIEDRRGLGISLTWEPAPKGTYRIEYDVLDDGIHPSWLPDIFLSYFLFHENAATESCLIVYENINTYGIYVKEISFN